MAIKKRGRPKNPKPVKDVINELIPVDDIFTPEEKGLYNKFLNTFLQDFDEDQLTANDMDDIVSIAVNRVLELRLLKLSKDNVDMQLDASAAIEKLRKQSDKLKENLATRRRDRIDPKKMGGFSIIDLAVNFDEEKKGKLFEKRDEFLEEELELIQSPLLVGNREDLDVFAPDKED